MASPSFAGGRPTGGATLLLPGFSLGWRAGGFRRRAAGAEFVMADEADGDGNQRGRQSPKPVIVGIGASAGGIRALQSFFEAIPNDTGAAFVVIVHLDPASRSELSAIIGARSSIPVSQVATTDHLEPDHVYVIPPDRQLQLTDHEISAAEFDEPRGRRAPIDLF